MAEDSLSKVQQIEQETTVLKPNADAIVPESTEEPLPNLNEFDNSDVAAVTKIQSGFRGMQARKQVKEMKEVQVEKEEVEELPELDSFDNNEVAAITKIQSGFRGMQARKQVEGMKANQTEEVVVAVEEEEPEEELPKLDEFNNDEVNAITKIQSGFRGMQARKQVEEMKKETAVVEPEEAEEELPKLEEFDDAEVDAITKIQSGFRGMKARKEVKKLKESDSHEEITSPVTSGPDDEVPELLDTRPMTAQTNAEAVEIPESARTVTE